MKKERDEMTDLFRSALGDAELTVRDHFWEDLNQDVAVCEGRHRRILFFRVAAAASVLLVLAVSAATIWYVSPKEEIGEAFSQLAVVTGEGGQLDGDVVKQKITPIQAQPILQTPAPKPVSLLAQHPDEDDDSISVTVSMSFSFSAVSSTQRRANKDGQEGLWQAGGNTGTAIVQEEKEQRSPVIKDPVHKMRPWSVKAAIGTALPAGDGKYKMPFTVGVTVEKKLNRRLGVETGLLYSRLHSDKTLHYLGIPVKLNVTLAETRKFDLYASIGGVADKCIAGLSDVGFGSEPIQLAATAGVGVNYKLNHKIALFAEPGVTHHFKTDSQTETVRTKRPTNFNLICGVRMTY